jgi:putative heme-binding domain-containing protein
MPEHLAQAVREHVASRDGGPVVAALRSQKQEALPAALKVLADGKAALAERTAVAKALGEMDWPSAVPTLLAVLTNTASPATLKRSALLATARYPEADVPGAVLSTYESRIAGDPALREAALRVLAGRVEWAEALVRALEDSRVPLKHISPEMVSLLVQHRTKSALIEEALQRHWRGAVGGISAAEKLKESERLRASLREGTASAPEGQKIFQQLCASCHKLFGSGNMVGPELTGYERANVNFWVDNIVYPSLEIREGFGAYTARTRAGQLLVGMLDSEGAGEVVLRDLTGQKTRLRRDDILSLEANPASLMPEGLVQGLNAQQVRDLFAYLMRPGPEAP